MWISEIAVIGCGKSIWTTRTDRATARLVAVPVDLECVLSYTSSMKTHTLLALTLLLTGCASDGWQYMAPPKGTYSLSVDGARNNPPGPNGYITSPNRAVVHEYRYGHPTGRTFETR